jgi:formylglycine-generating enzyme required for sulfatase activity
MVHSGHFLCLALLAVAAVAQTSTTSSPPGAAEPDLGPAKELTDEKSGAKLLLIPAGTFTMGCTPGDPECFLDEAVRHEVTISHPFYLASTETTVGQYRRYASATGRGMPPAPSFPQTEDHPVVSVLWDEARSFCEWTGGRLPTEAEWEYAARGGGSNFRYPWGNVLSRDHANYRGAEGRDRWKKTSPVASFDPNALGLYDMAGNASEWVGDWHDFESLLRKPSNLYYAISPAQDPTGPPAGKFRVLRGGGWSYPPQFLRVSIRARGAPDRRYDAIGFRCSRPVTH